MADLPGRPESAAAAPEVRRLTDLVPYQQGSVVSRTIIKKPAGTVTLFAFDAGEGLSEHTAPFEALVCVLDGVAEVRIDGVPYRVAAGETITLPAGHPHAVKAVERFQMLLVMVRS
jgi:quercetin dioxygenase-like cupin family protein